MPIKPENKHRYPPDWDQIRARIRERAGDCCEQCGVRNRAWGFRVAGEFHPIKNKQQVIELVRRGREWVKPPFTLFVSPKFGTQKIIEIVCTVAHLDHIPEHCDDDNLRYWCQRCHLRHDQPHHLQTAYHTRREGKAIDMFEVNA